MGSLAILTNIYAQHMLQISVLMLAMHDGDEVVTIQVNCWLFKPHTCGAVRIVWQALRGQRLGHYIGPVW